MKNVRFFANVVKTVAACVVGMGMGFVLTSCDKEGLADHSNKEEGKGKITVTPTPTPTPKDSLWENSWVTVVNTVIGLDWKYFKNDTIVDSLKNSTNVAAQIARNLDKIETTVNHLNNLGITAGQVVESRDGRNNYVFRQVMTDLDGQTYNGEFKSGYATLKDLVNVHGKLVGFQTTGFRNIPQPTPADMDTLVITRVGWKAIFEVENAKNLAGQTFEISLDSTDHFRYIPKGAPQIVGRKPFQYKDLGIWKSTWTFGFHYYWDNGTVTGDSMQVTLNASYETIELKDKVVSNLVDYSHADGTLKFKERTAAQSNDTRVKKFNNRYEKESYATNGISADEFRTLFVITVQDATAEFCDTTWTFKADEVAMTTTRNVFVDEDSDRDGYTMVRFTDTESAKYADGRGDNTVALKESCKLYLKIAAPAELDKIEFAGTKVHTNGMAKINGSITPVFTDGTKGGAISFKWSKAESWTWLKDSVIFENVDFAMEETGKLTLKGEESKTEKTFATSNDDITIKCNQYDADFQVGVKVDGGVKYTTWHATWYEDFKVVYNNKSVSLTKSSYNVKNQNDKLTKDEARSNATSEVWGYSVEGLFNIDEDSRSAYGYGRLTKAIEEKVIRTYWDETSKGQSHTVLESTRWATLVREYNTGKKTTQEYKHVFNRLSGSSKWEITAEEGSETATGSMILENANEENRADDFAHFTLKKFELGQYFDVPGAAQQHDKVTFTESMGAYFEAKDQDGKAIKIFFEDPSYSFTNNVKSLTVKSENENETVYQHENVVNWKFGGATTTLSATGLIHVAKSQETPDFDIEVGKIYASVSRPSNRNASDITAYTYLLVSKDGKKCLPLGIYHNVVTVGEITDMQAGFNSACYVKNENKVVATRAYSDSGLGMMIWCGADGNPVDAASHITLQGAGFNDRGNDWVNHTGKYAPRATKKGNVTTVTFEGTNVSYTFRGWNV